MVRTKADGAGRRAVAAKAPRKQVGGSSSPAGSGLGSPGGSGKSKSRCAGGNPVKWWPSPSWQKGIGNFFSSDPNNDSTEEACSSSKQPGMSSEELKIEKAEDD